jgi:biopolymer transport protein ExbB
MIDLLKAGGWIMFPILFCSIAAFVICIERSWSLRRTRITPKHLVAQVWGWIKQNQLDRQRIKTLRASSPLGEVLAAGLVNHVHGREIMKASIHDTGRLVVIHLERYLNTLGTIAQITPLLGLLGTVIGMIRVFTVITVQGTGDSGALAHGISEALITTATGLIIAIPTLIFHRHFERRVDELVAEMEREALKMVDVMNADKPAKKLK